MQERLIRRHRPGTHEGYRAGVEATGLGQRLMLRFWNCR